MGTGSSDRQWIDNPLPPLPVTEVVVQATTVQVSPLRRDVTDSDATVPMEDLSDEESCVKTEFLKAMRTCESII